MRQNYKGNKMRKEALRRQKQEEKRLKRQHRKEDDHSAPLSDETSQTPPDVMPQPNPLA